MDPDAQLATGFAAAFGNVGGNPIALGDEGNVFGFEEVMMRIDQAVELQGTVFGGCQFPDQPRAKTSAQGFSVAATDFKGVRRRLALCSVSCCRLC
jgi:hypothetical protein